MSDDETVVAEAEKEEEEAPYAGPPSAQSGSNIRYRGMRNYVWTKDFPEGTPITEKDIEWMWTKLSPAQETFCTLRMWNKARRVVCRQLKIDPDTGLRWEQAPWFRPWIIRERQRLFGLKEGAFMPLLPTSLRRIEAELTGEHGDDIAHNSAWNIVHMVYGKPVQGGIGKVEATGAFDPAQFLNALGDFMGQFKEQQRARVLEASKAVEPDGTL